MTGKTHLITGAALGLAVASISNQDINHSILLAVAGGVGGLLPDVDHPQSYINQRLLPLRVVSLFVTHRGITHTWLAALLVAVSAGWLANLLGWPELLYALGGGYLLHIVADMLTIRGAPLLYPLPYRHLLPRAIRVKTGGLVEVLLLILVVVASLALLRDALRLY